MQQLEPPGTTAVGALFGCGLLGGAILSHLTTLVLEVPGDHGLPFTLALATRFASPVAAFIGGNCRWSEAHANGDTP